MLSLLAFKWNAKSVNKNWLVLSQKRWSRCCGSKKSKACLKTNIVWQYKKKFLNRNETDNAISFICTQNAHGQALWCLLAEPSKLCCWTFYKMIYYWKGGILSTIPEQFCKYQWTNWVGPGILDYLQNLTKRKAFCRRRPPKCRPKH